MGRFTKPFKQGNPMGRFTKPFKQGNPMGRFTKTDNINLIPINTHIHLYRERIHIYYETTY